ncbi:unnamed protein product [Diabrotica balteata]|uniref:Cytochrome P450 n=1 Tax=Diabrotica balteata TaxID=107213 RepID=A0A9N9SQ07_DIABA|nr:unnamed protein product [Diabrotica balteata]
MLQLILVAVVIGGLFYYYGVKPLRYWKERGVKQTNPWWLFGDNWGVVLQRESFPDMITKGYNTAPEARYSGLYQFTLPTLVIKDLNLIKQIGVKDFDYFMDHRPFIPEKADPLWGKNLFALTGQRWKEMRPILSPSFTSSKMKSMFVLMSECGENLVNYFMEKDKDSTEIEMKDTFTRFTNDVIASAAFGVKIDSLKNHENEFYLMGKHATNFKGFWKTMKFFGYMLIPKIWEVFGIYQFTFPTLLIRDVNLIKQIGVKDFDYFMDHFPFLPEKADPLWSKNLFALTGQRWKDMRPILSPSFTSSKMKSMFLLMSECGENLVKFFMENNKNTIEIEMKDTFTRFTNDVIATTAFGLQVDSLRNPENEFYLMGKEATDFSGFWKGVKFFGYSTLPKIFELGLSHKISLFSTRIAN